MIAVQVEGSLGGRLAQQCCLLVLHTPEEITSLTYSLQYSSEYFAFSCASPSQGVNNYRLNFVKILLANFVVTGRNWYNTDNEKLAKRKRNVHNNVTLFC